MASFKGDPGYRVYYDDPPPRGDSDSEVSLDEPAQYSRSPFTVWWDANYDVIEELYRAFLEGGVKVFGSAFYQSGGLHQFAYFIYAHTHIF